MDKKTLKIICLNFCCGRKHDFKLFKESEVHAGENTEFETDTGYTGITAIHPNSLLPKKNRKNNPLSKEEKRNNCIISRKRIYVEHAIRFVKRFRICQNDIATEEKDFHLGFLCLLVSVTLICLFNFARGLLFWHYSGFAFIYGDYNEHFLNSVYGLFLSEDCEISRRFILFVADEKVKEFFLTKDRLILEKRYFFEYQKSFSNIVNPLYKGTEK